MTECVADFPLTGLAQSLHLDVGGSERDADLHLYVLNVFNCPRIYHVQALGIWR